MLHKVMEELRGERLVARDGRAGSVKDVYFDDERWKVRYLVVRTGEWRFGRKVLVSPASVVKDPWDRQAIQLTLSRDELEHAPDADTDMPVSRQLEEARARYYRHTYYYWSGPYLWGATPLPGSVAERADAEAWRELKRAEEQAGRSHLRSSRAVVGHGIEALDGPIGHVEDFVVDDEAWAVTGVAVDTRNWLPGSKVIVTPGAVRAIDWNRKKVFLRMSRGEVEGARAA